MTDPTSPGPADKQPAGPGPSKSGTATAVPPEAIRAIPVRHPLRWVSAAVVLALLGLLVYAFANADIEWGDVPEYLFADRVIEAAGKTLLVTVLAMLLGVVLGIVLAIMRLSDNPVTSAFANLYIWFFRGTPVLLQLLLWYNLGLVFQTLNLGPFYKNEMTDVMTPFMAALLGLGLNEAAYMAEIVRAGIQSVDEGQTEASHALGMSQGKTMRRIVLPQAMRVIVPPTGNEFINMLKTSSLAMVIQYTELTFVATEISTTRLNPMEMYIVVAIWYLAMTSVFSVIQYYIERHYAKGSVRQLPPTPWQKIRRSVFSGPRLMGTR
ncbi:ABC transporter permease subunit [Streptomyces synnematoformans]|uniref:Amino acid ABC transporter permease n=1 Tax=Streptomyces synnematoformans TaxID=415721 RepID=A0ABN2Y990_9ACTN